MSETPLMQQYREIKARHQDAILFFRMGDFFEMFYEDAEVGSRVLGLTLTSRNNGAAAAVPLAGVPAKAVSEYVKRLVRKGFRVAICEQVEDPKFAKGPVRREVIETVTPGAALADDLLDGARNNYLVALHSTGLAAVDVSTGEFRLATAPAQDAASLVARFAPREVLIARGATIGVPLDGVLVTEREPYEFDAATGAEGLSRRFGVQSLEGFGIQSTDAPAIAAAGALLEYLKELQPGGLPHLARPVVERPGGAVPLDEMTRRNLELVESLRGEAAGTLLDVLDRTSTPMGARLLRQWIVAPLSDRAAINARLDRVEALANDSLARAALREALDGVRDVERLAGKVAAARATPRELRALGDSLSHLPEVCAAAARVGLADPWDICDDVAAKVTHLLVERPPVAIGEEPTIATGIDAKVDELRTLRDGGKDAIADIQAAERARTGISSLKVGYNRVFGYYIEITNANKDAVPADYQRRQTLTGAERYVTPALKEYEERVLTAAERLEVRERELFESLRASTGAQVSRLQHIARRVAELDVVSTFAEVAERERFVRPVVTDDLEIDIVGGRHPVVERMMPREQFIPNDVRLSTAERVIILTGPNMAGKSTILRQVGLIVLMAQCGSFVPAARATIGIVDRLFTRVGASDNLVRGQSTFMVEMAETSAILHTATSRSLVLLDEIGRGTSTYDGVSIAWSVTEHLHSRVGCKTIFATHYHELTQLADELPALRNYNVAVREVGDRVLFLHRMQPGGADRSYGIEVGRLAGLPDLVLARAREVLRRLEAENLVSSPRPVEQLTLFAPEPHAALKRLAELDLDRMTPLQALSVLAELKELA
ncbi:MAG TPA: DNA mismatch repair protein MutS [Gemmatimonadaceae bacterium]|nr:DNA mismatch repair protein MutS [Gemmatimonadaceae bacterium]